MNAQFNDQLFDLSYLNQIFQGNTEMINNIIKLFLEQVPEYVGEMVECVERNDYLALHPIAHKAKSSIAMLGLKSMEKMVLQIENDSKYNQNWDEIRNLVYQIKEESEVVYAQLRELLTSNNAA